MDTKFISVVKPHGIKGTFNLCSPNLSKYTPSFYRELYSGFGISNHCKMHPFLLKEDETREISEDAFDINTADENKLYKTDREGVYYFKAPAGWRKKATLPEYSALLSESHNELEGIFGEGSVTTFVWPFGDQNSEEILDYISRELGYTAARKTGLVEDKTGFAVPTDRMHWSYNASHKNLLECAEKYDKFIDDGELKFFSFGVHSVDYENANKWDELSEFAAKYGNRPNDFYYASVEDIFGYVDASNAIKITENVVENPSAVDIYLEINGEKRILSAGETLRVD
jgi:hypothetical protein